VARIEILLCRKGRSIPFSEWLALLRDVRAVAIVRARLNRIRLGNFGDSNGRDGSLIVILLCGGDKRTQARDILVAQKRWKEYLDAKTND
jgi:putative component of toxin-antitoxin plasmid stabilization module